MQIMKNVKLTVNLRRFLKSLTIFLLMFIFVLAGTAFTSFTEGEIKKAATKDSTTTDKKWFYQPYSNTKFRSGTALHN